MDKNKSTIFYVLLVLLTISVFFNAISISKRYKGNMGAVSDTTRVTIFDTIPYYKPVPKDSLVVRYKTIYVPKYDESIPNDTSSVDTPPQITDSVKIEIPITQKVYEDSTYKAWVSGYCSSLDSIYVYPRKEIITITNKPKPKRWGIGIHAGYGVTLEQSPRLTPYIGIGISYNLFSF